MSDPHRRDQQSNSNGSIFSRPQTPHYSALSIPFFSQTPQSCAYGPLQPMGKKLLSSASLLLSLDPSSSQNNIWGPDLNRELSGGTDTNLDISQLWTHHKLQN